MPQSTMPQSRQPDPLDPCTIRYGLKDHVCAPVVLPYCPVATAFGEHTLVALSGLYAPSPIGYRTHLAAIGYAVKANGQPFTGAFTAASKIASRPPHFQPSLARLLGLILPAAGVEPKGLRSRTPPYSRPLTVFIHFRNPNVPDCRGAGGAFSPALPAAMLRPAMLRVRVPFAPSQVYSVNVMLVDTTFFLSDLHCLEDIITHLRLPVASLTPAEEMDPGLLRISDPGLLVRYAAQRAEMTMVGGSTRAANLLEQSGGF